MDVNVIDDDIFCSDSEEDWNNSDDGESFNHDEESFFADCLTRGQEVKCQK